MPVPVDVVIVGNAISLFYGMEFGSAVLFGNGLARDRKTRKGLVRERRQYDGLLGVYLELGSAMRCY